MKSPRLSGPASIPSCPPSGRLASSSSVMPPTDGCCLPMALICHPAHPGLTPVSVEPLVASQRSVPCGTSARPKTWYTGWEGFMCHFSVGSALKTKGTFLGAIGVLFQITFCPIGQGLWRLAWACHGVVDSSTLSGSTFLLLLTWLPIRFGWHLIIFMLPADLIQAWVCGVFIFYLVMTCIQNYLHWHVMSSNEIQLLHFQVQQQFTHGIRKWHILPANVTRTVPFSKGKQVEFCTNLGLFVYNFKSDDD